MPVYIIYVTRKATQVQRASIDVTADNEDEALRAAMDTPDRFIDWFVDEEDVEDRWIDSIEEYKNFPEQEVIDE